MKKLTFLAPVIGLLIFSPVAAQTGGGYAIEQSVIAGGGGQNATGGAFALDGTIGQPIAGTRSVNQGFAVTGGFWSAPLLAPTAAQISVSGRVLTPDGRGLRNARVILTESNGTTRTFLTTSFGYYRFDEIDAGQTVIIQVVSKRFTFQPQIIGVNEDLTDFNFTALPNPNAEFFENREP